MDKIEEKLRKTGRAGFLVDAIFDDSPARGMYARRDWIPVPGGRDQFVFNLPKDVDPARFVGVEYRQTPIEDRAGN